MFCVVIEVYRLGNGFWFCWCNGYFFEWNGYWFDYGYVF